MRSLDTLTVYASTNRLLARLTIIYKYLMLPLTRGGEGGLGTDGMLGPALMYAKMGCADAPIELIGSKLDSIHCTVGGLLVLLTF